VQGIHGLRLKLPADDGFLLARITADPSVDKLARRIDFEIFAFHVEFRAVGSNSIAAPLASGAQIHGGPGDAVQTILSPPARELGRIADRLENARWRRGDEDLSDDGILVRRDGGSGHCLFLLDLRDQGSGIRGQYNS
jgi:hypothetical protein